MTPEEQFFSILESGIKNGSKEDIDSVAKHGGVHGIEHVFLYCATIVKAPKYAIEFSPHHGASTVCIAKALKRLNQGGIMATFELEKEFEKEFYKTIALHDVGDQVQIIFGDAIKTIPEFIHKHSLNQSVGFLFVDSDHSEKFADQYIKTIFPLMQPGCVVGIHDIGATIPGGSGEFNTSLFVQNENWEEYKSVQRWMNANKREYILLHGLTGGTIEGSTKLPINRDFYKKLDKLLGYDLMYQDQAPRSIWFKL